MKEKEIYQGVIFTLTQKQVMVNGMQVQRDIIHHPGGVGILLIHANRLLLVSQMRPAIDQKTIEIPAGKLEYGEDPYEAGMRELNEETGFTAKKLKPILTMVSTPGFCDEKIWIYEAIDPAPAKIKLDCDPDEDIETMWIDLATAQKWIQDGKIIDAKTILAIQHALLERR